MVRLGHGQLTSLNIRHLQHSHALDLLAPNIRTVLESQLGHMLDETWRRVQDLNTDAVCYTVRFTLTEANTPRSLQLKTIGEQLLSNSVIHKRSVG